MLSEPFDEDECKRETLFSDLRYIYDDDSASAIKERLDKGISATHIQAFAIAGEFVYANDVDRGIRDRISAYITRRRTVNAR